MIEENGVLDFVAPDEDIQSLARWLRDEDGLTGRVGFTESAPRDGEMGGAIEALSVILGSGVAKQAVTSFFEWLKHRRTAEQVKILVKSPGRTDHLELECGSATDADSVLRSVERFLDGKE
ncbi:effector-associated constant component EACC1 [Amycolatopsis sp. CA-230715]|uniref:effector-associated constant component EACC1 n=1 Tax=Amycolatopsis sp. CA-230715 TaxID=2745196 RepID=UPI001C016A95|nr:hypothetical protein [Amycolatopsis sp. CA-230715]QWF80396.1 hypothetical protein HUW46_03817 [Amycolatopsis sp. CA-230715]